MTLQDFLPDIIPSNQDRLGKDSSCQRRKSMNDISKSCVNNIKNNNHTNNREENILHRSLRNFDGLFHCQRQVSHPCETDTDIELQIDLNKPSIHPFCKRCTSDPLPLSNLAMNHNLDQDMDDTDGPISDRIESQVTAENTDGAAGDDSNSDGTREDQLMREEAKNHLQRRVTELFQKHLPEMPVDPALEKEPDEKLCHDIVVGLKDIADSFDQRHKGKNPIQAIQETLNLNLPQLLLPRWLQNGVGPAVAEATLKAVQQYNRF